MKKTSFIISFVALHLFISPGVKAQNMALVWDSLKSGTSDSINPIVKTLIIDSTLQGLYCGGDFKIAGGNQTNHISKWDCYTQWATLGTGVNGEVSASTFYKSKLIVGGLFDSAGGISASNIATWDGSVWDSLSGNLNGEVYSLLGYDSILYVGGKFTQVNGLTANRFIKWNGSTWIYPASGFDSGAVYTLILFHDTLFAGGSFTHSNGKKINHVSYWNHKTNTWDSLQNGFNNNVYTFAVYNNSLYAGGAFDSTGIKAINHIAIWTGKKWDTVGNGLNDTVKALGIGNVPVPLIAKHSFIPNFGGYYLMAGGSFTMSGDTICSHLAGWIGSYYTFDNNWFGLGKVNGTVNAISCENDDNYKTYIGGDFDTVNGNLHANHIASIYLWDTNVLGGINELYNDEEVSVFPNPNNGSFEIELKTKNEELKQLEVYNILGEKIYSSPFSTFNYPTPVNLNKLTEGVYLLRVRDNKATLLGTGKLIIAK